MLIASLTVGILALTGQLLFWHLYVLSFVSGTLSAFSIPARHALFAGLVPRSSMQSAVTFNAVAVRAGALIGPSIGGGALAYGGFAPPLFFKLGGFLWIFFAFWGVCPPPRRPGA